MTKLEKEMNECTLKFTKNYNNFFKILTRTETSSEA